MFIVCSDIALVLWTLEISLHKSNSHDLHRVITHSLVLVIILWYWGSNVVYRNQRLVLHTDTEKEPGSQGHFVTTALKANTIKPRNAVNSWFILG